MPSVVKLLLFTLSASASFLPVLPRDFNSLLANFTGLSSRADNITTTINKYTVNSSNESFAPTVAAAYSGFASLTTVTKNNCKATGPLTSAQAQSILNSVAQSLIPKLRSSLGAIIGKRPLWKKDGRDNFTQGVFLVAVECGHDLGVCLVNGSTNSPSSIQSSASALSASLTSLIASGRSAYFANTATAI